MINVEIVIEFESILGIRSKNEVGVTRITGKIGGGGVGKETIRESRSNEKATKRFE